MAEPLLTLTDLHKAFGAVRATDGVSLDVRAGEIHALIGPNGAGKSTLVSQIAGFLTPDAGALTLDGHDLAGLSPARRARLGLGRTFQISSLVPEFSALRNAMLAVQARAGSSFRFWRRTGDDPDLLAPAHAALERVGLTARADVPAAALSHGERRQLEVAVALALQPRVLLLDEPMAGLGSGGSTRLTGFLAGLKGELAILLIEHDMDAVFALADRISVLVYGRVIASGTVAEIRADPEVRRAYLGDTPC